MGEGEAEQGAGEATDPPAEERVTSRSDPAAFLGDPDRLATFIEKLRASGVRNFVHPSGLQVAFEPGARANPNW
jgi:hypothetical protein